MIEVANIFHRYGQQYREKYKDRMPPSHLRAMRDIEDCRTKHMGGHVYVCENEACEEENIYVYHSCKNRHCPKCQNDQAELWLQKQQNRLLPVLYFLVTFTLPEELRSVTRSNQKALYNILFQTSAAALQKLALDPRFLGGHIGMTGVLHTWDRILGYHPHIHYLVPGGGLSPDHTQWLPSKNDFLVRVEPLSIIFRAKFKAALKEIGLFKAAASAAWNKNWVVHSKPVASGKEAMVYLARYVFRVAISNNRLLNIDNDQVTFEYQNSETKELRQMTVTALSFIRRFLQHILPKGFIKVRYYGLLSPANRNLLAVVMHLLEEHTPAAIPKPAAKAELCCPKCCKPLRFVGRIDYSERGPPL